MALVRGYSVCISWKLLKPSGMMQQFLFIVLFFFFSEVHCGSLDVEMIHLRPCHNLEVVRDVMHKCHHVKYGRCADFVPQLWNISYDFWVLRNERSIHCCRGSSGTLSGHNLSRVVARFQKSDRANLIAEALENKGEAELRGQMFDVSLYQ